MVSQGIKRGFDRLVVVCRLSIPAKGRKESRAECVVLEHAVQVAALDASIGAGCAFGAGFDLGKGAISIGALGAADVNFVAIEW